MIWNLFLFILSVYTVYLKEALIVTTIQQKTSKGHKYRYSVESGFCSYFITWRNGNWPLSL